MTTRPLGRPNGTIEREVKAARTAQAAAMADQRQQARSAETVAQLRAELAEARRRIEELEIDLGCANTEINSLRAALRYAGAEV